MTPSIRTFLLINLLLSVTLITSLAIIGNLFLAHKDIQLQLDTQLVRTALRIKAFVGDGTNEKNLQTIQNNLANSNIAQNQTKQTQAQKNAVEFQIWDAKGKLILHSVNAPNVPFSDGGSGLINRWLNHKSWRVNTLYNAKDGLTIMVAERANYRQQLENQLTQDSIFIMLITYPFLGFLIWVIVGRGLDTLKKVAEEVRHRAPTYLKPVGLESVPSEISPLVSELNSLFDRLQEAFNREKRFAADAAHELKTPLAALSTQTQVALRASDPQERNNALLKVLAGVNRSTHVVQQLLTMSRMVPDANIKEPTPVNLSKQAADVAALLAPEAIAKNIDLELISPDQQTTIMGNPTSISILIRNLVDNAIRYTHKNGNIKIKIKPTKNNIKLYVIDNGPGIPEALRDRVFERFFRVIGNQTTGSGLGLGIALQIVKLHNADIQLETSAGGKGLTVCVIFPKQ